MPHVVFDIAIRASQGARRSQEDCALSWPHGSVRDDSATLVALPVTVPGEAALVLCDGMGGHAGGALASRLACDHFLPVLLEGDAGVGDRLMAALEAANGAIAQHVAENSAHAGMGSTLVGVHVGPQGLSWISVGDSLLYLVRQGGIDTLNADHSLAPEIDKLAATGRISWDVARRDPRRHYLRSALTGDEIEMIDLSAEAAQLLAGDVLVVASDGIHTLEPDAIAGLVVDAGRAGAAAIADRLLGAVEAEREPHQDNTTVAVICVQTAAGDTPDV